MSDKVMIDRAKLEELQGALRNLSISALEDNEMELHEALVPLDVLAHALAPAPAASSGAEAGDAFSDLAEDDHAGRVKRLIELEGPKWKDVGDAVAWVRNMRGDLPAEPEEPTEAELDAVRGYLIDVRTGSHTVGNMRFFAKRHPGADLSDIPESWADLPDGAHVTKEMHAHVLWRAFRRASLAPAPAGAE